MCHVLCFQLVLLLAMGYRKSAWHSTSSQYNGEPAPLPMRAFTLRPTCHILCVHSRALPACWATFRQSGSELPRKIVMVRGAVKQKVVCRQKLCLPPRTLVGALYGQANGPPPGSSGSGPGLFSGGYSRGLSRPAVSYENAPAAKKAPGHKPESPGCCSLDGWSA